jgi:DNA ligase-1
MAKAEYLMQLERWTDQNVADWFVSEKLNGLRLFWDGGVTTGMRKGDVPWANCARDKKDYTATGLWSRRGQVVHAPYQWLEGLPKGVCLDGEGYNGIRNDRQAIMSCVACENPDPHLWADVSLWCFDAVPYKAFCASRVLDDLTIRRVECEKLFTGCLDWPDCTPLKDRLWYVHEHIGKWASCMEVMQHQYSSMDVVNDYYDRVVAAQGEGIVCRHGRSKWEPIRNKMCLKRKGFHDDEGVVVGYTAGEGKLTGRVGCFIVRNGDAVFGLSGFTDDERMLCPEGREWAIMHPGERLPAGMGSMMFPLGAVVTYKYWGLTDAGLPNEARYWRVRED